MNNLPKSRISELKECFLQWRNDYDPVEDAPQYSMFSDAMAAMDMLLSGMEQEPVAWLLSGGGAKNVVVFDNGNAYADPLREVTPLYAAPVVSDQPAPVVKPVMFIDGDISSEDADKLAKILQEFNAEDPLDNSEYGSAYQGVREDLSIWKRRALEAEEKLRTAPVAVPECFQRLLKHAHGMSMGVDWNNGTSAGFHREKLLEAVKDCRAAMLSAAPKPPVSDGWIKCSERMPDDRKSVLLWDADLDDALSGHYSHKTGVFYCAGMTISNEISHWMPLPNPPAPEA